MIRKQSTDPVFDQVSVCLSDAAHRNTNQKYVFLLKKTLIFDGLSMLMSYAVLFSRISLAKFLKKIAPKACQTPKEISFSD